jgi:DNA-binding FadR family transcriptional regulator
VRISQGGATRVQDWRETAGLEVLLDLVASPGGPPPELARAVLEMRESIGVDAARRCAARAGAQQRAAIAALAEEAARAIDALPPASSRRFTSAEEVNRQLDGPAADEAGGGSTRPTRSCGA